MSDENRVSFSQLFPLLESEIRCGHSFSFTASGVSMLPFIRDGKDRVTLSPISGPLQVGDIIFYRRKNGSFILHRIVRKEKDGSLTLCGDNQYYLEKNIQEDQVIARLTGLKRNGKNISLTSPRARAWFLCLPARRFILHVRASIKGRMKKLFS